MENYTPKVDTSSEFLEIANDFGKELEIIREALANSYDWDAKFLKINVLSENDKLIIEFTDDGMGMNKERLEAFWDLGSSKSRGVSGRIGSKGHGTKIYLNSDKILVETKSKEGVFVSECSHPKDSLIEGHLHKPTIKEVADTDVKSITTKTGTYIRIEGYNNNETSKFRQDRVTDYLLWFTKLGSIENAFKNTDNLVDLDDLESSNINLEPDEKYVDIVESTTEESIEDTSINKLSDIKSKEFCVLLKCLNTDRFEKIEFGHVFPEINDNIENLKKYKERPSDHYVKAWKKSGILDDNPEYYYDMLIYIEGDAAKRTSNGMIRKKGDSSNNGKYKVSDRYGLWLAKDGIPIERKNEWISSFGNGSNSIVLVHAFLNCQKFKLTANRGSINISSKVEEKLIEVIDKAFEQIDEYLKKQGLFQLIEETKQEENINKLKDQEKKDYEDRCEKVSSRKHIEIPTYVVCCYDEDGELVQKNNITKLIVPNNEAEVIILLSQLLVLIPKKFDFEILDYTTFRGIDCLIKQNSVGIDEKKYRYLEIKHTLSTRKFNHSFENTRWLVCWDKSDDIAEDSEIQCFDGETRKLKRSENKWFLDSIGKNPIQVIFLKEVIESLNSGGR